MKFKIISLLILILIFTNLWGNAQDSLKIVIDRDYPPFTYVDEKGNLVGISVDFWKLWSKKNRN